MIIMLSTSIPLLPIPLEIKSGDPSKVCELLGNGKIHSNCPSDRIQSHIQNILSGLSEEIKWDFPSDASKLMQRYPLWISPTP